ncbi:zinc finger protein 800-like [Huso huso]|uniref:Zinc finger protein 800-like n=1 Tax=Huso huso TaxID=61971 RepID=A0ABR0ZCU2_HUSHU
MEKSPSAIRKTSHFLRNQHTSKNDSDVEDNKPRMQRTPVKDQCSQTEHHHHGCCEPAYAMEPGDPPLLQQQLQTSKSGIQQIIECFRSGTAQLKNILLKEVDTIFECKLCRSLFRGLPNLITHKEFYCFPRLKLDNDPSASNDKQSQAIKDLLEAIYPRKEKQEYVVRLEPIETNQNAVYQYVAGKDDQETVNYSSQTQHQGHLEEPSPEQNQTEVPPGTEIVEPTPVEDIKKEVKVSMEDEAIEPFLCLDETSNSDTVDQQVACCICGKDFNTRRSVRRHIRKVHKKKMEELKKNIETRRGGPNPPSVMTGRSKSALLSSGRSCPVCQKSFATKANVRRHFDEVHRGLRRDCITPDIATKPGQPLSLETNGSPKKSPGCLPRRKKYSARAEYNLTARKCLLCKRKYSSQVMLKKHLRIVHKMTKLERGSNGTISSTEIKVKVETSDLADHNAESSEPDVSQFPPNDSKGTGQAAEKRHTPTAQKNKGKQESDSPKSSSPPAAGGQQKVRKPKLSMGFDFKQLYCKLCKRQFTSKQNLTKHIDLHTDGNEIYIKFYRCPLCLYETRRKRDVIRHITVVHKKSSRYLAKITANLESRAVKKPVEMVLNSVVKRGPQKDEGKSMNSKQDGTPSSQSSRKHDTVEVGTEVKFAKNLSLHTYNKCGKAFAKKTYLEQHKKTLRTSASSSPEESKTTGRSTRSKAVF